MRKGRDFTTQAKVDTLRERASTTEQAESSIVLRLMGLSSGRLNARIDRIVDVDRTLFVRFVLFFGTDKQGGLHVIADAIARES